MPTTTPRPDGDFTILLKLYTMRELVDELVRRLGLAELCRQTGLSFDTIEDLQQWADEAYAELSRARQELSR